MKGMFRVESGVVDRILEVTDYKPFRIQGVCRDLVKRGHEQRRKTITIHDVEEVAQAGGV